MKYGIDLDGVIADFGGEVVKIGNTLWPGKFPIGYVPDNWNYEGYLTKDEWDQVWAAIDMTPDFWRNEKSMDGMLHLRDHLFYNHSDEVYFITARRQTMGDSPMVQSADWLTQRGLFPRQGHSTVIAVEEAKHKKDLFRSLGIHSFLDDYAPTVEQLNSLNADGFEMHAYILDQPWNRYMKDQPRVFSVAEYLQKLRTV